MKLRLSADKRERTRSCTHPTSSAPRPERTCTGRAGVVTQGTRNGADGSAIARQTGHASLDSVETYRRDSGTVVGDVVATWMFLGVFGLVIFVPVTTLSLLGAAALGNRNFRVGRWLASAGAVAATLLYAYLAFVVIEEAAAPEMRDPNGRGPQLTRSPR